MRTFFATCGALALMIPVGMLQSEHTNAQDGFRPNHRRTVRSFTRVQSYNNCSTRNRPAVQVSRCGLTSCGVAGCDARLPTANACRSGRCGKADCSTCQTSRLDFCGSDGRTNQPRSTADSRVPQDRVPPLDNRRDAPLDSRSRDREPPSRQDDRAVPDGESRPNVSDRGRAQPIGVQWRTDIRAANRESSETGLPILMKFSAKWCGPCKRMKSETFTDPALAEMINTCFIPVEVDTDQNEQLARQLRIESVPTTMVISRQGDIVERREGFQSATQLKGAIARFCQEPANRPIVRNEPRSRNGR
jgi:thiol-disulfide isomerase/thioredoxin